MPSFSPANSRAEIVTVTREVWIIGCGYVGQRLAMAELAEGARVHAVARSPESLQPVTAPGVAARRADLDDPESLAALDPQGADVYYLAPPPSHGRTDPRMQAFLRALSKRAPRRIVYISTTGVYGDCQGEWVAEDQPTRPSADRAYRRVDAESQLRAFGETSGVAVVILRVPGIYGPGRLPRERLEKGLAVLREADAPWSNRIHVDDLVTTCLAAMRRAAPGTVYNVSDGNPSTMTDYFNHVADVLGLPRPPQVSRSEAERVIDPGMRSYLAESRRIDSRRMREELGVVPRYATVVEGLAACLAAEAGAPFAAKA